MWHAPWVNALFGVVAAIASAALAYALGRKKRDEESQRMIDAARAEASALTRAAELEAQAGRLAAETEAREQALELRTALEKEVGARFETIARREERAQKREQATITDAAELQARLDALSEREREAQSKGDRAKNARGDVQKIDAELLATLERSAGTTATQLKAQLSESWVEEVRAESAQRLRGIDQNTQDPEYARQAKRVMGIAVGRYHAHFLTERLLSNVPIPQGFAEYLSANENLWLNAIAEASGVKLELNETGEKVRLDSGDGVAREVARRAVNKLIKGTAPRDVEKNPKKWVEQLRTNLDKEIFDLGKRAFSDLEIPKAHAEIVTLVGRLNYRTSYTQNQWKHALEAAYLGGMMAAELGLDVKLMRRATLMHDIGKSLTHEIEGSHAVIGADYARRLGETEIVANAIGAHHADEPPNSIYAYLVAAADAMSGARPGARREQTEQYSTKLDDLERIGGSFRGVSRAIAVQGGREVRVYVDERQVNDLRAVELTAEIAKKISAEMTFPGQIKVTVIRSLEAVATAN
jgi:ribonuclease Y